MIIPISNTSKNFYLHMGKLFGSRLVERSTGDRVYDDDDKVWYVFFDKGKPNAFVSLKGSVIKNVWTYNSSQLILVLEEIKAKVSESLVTKYFKDEYIKAGYSIVDDSTKNFIRIRGGHFE